MIRYNIEYTIVRTSPNGEEVRTAVKGIVSRNDVHLPIDTDVERGDLLIRALPSGKQETRRVLDVHHFESPFGSGRGGLDHIEATTEVLPQRPTVVKRQVTLPGLHEDISKASGSLFADGHFSSAVFEAFRAVEERVQSLAGRQDTGQSLMGQVFSSGSLDITTTTGRSADDERDGFKLLFMGVITGLRNPRGHGKEVASTEEETLEYLAVASMLMRRLDLAAERLKS